MFFKLDLIVEHRVTVRVTFKSVKTTKGNTGKENAVSMARTTFFHYTADSGE